jgi:hypothetical protein
VNGPVEGRGGAVGSPWYELRRHLA